jgi:hypothetical protein
MSISNSLLAKVVPQIAMTMTKNCQTIGNKKGVAEVLGNGEVVPL